MLAEAVALIRRLWEGGLTNHRGDYYEVHNARWPETFVAA